MSKQFRFAAITPDPLDFTGLQSMADDDPIGLLDRCRRRQRSIRKGTRALNWELWVACYAGALGIKKQPERLGELLKHEFFEQRTYAASLDAVLRLALLIGTDADADGRTYKNACYVASRLQSLFVQEVEPEGVLQLIENAGGLKRLYGDDDEVEEDQGKLNDDGGENADAASKGGSANGLKLGGRPNRSSRPTQPDRRDSPQHRTARGRLVRPDTDTSSATDDLDSLGCKDKDEIILEVVVTGEILHELLNSPLGSRARLNVEHVPSNVEWKRIEATSAKIIN